MIETKTTQGEAVSTLGGFFPETVVSLAARCSTISLPRGKGGYDIRLARTHFQQGAVNRLVRRMYAWRGYSMQPSTYPPNDQNRMTLAVWEGDDVVATLTIGRDSPGGLLADGLYAPELAGLRHRGRTVCEVTRLAVHPEFSCGNLLNALFHTALLFGRSHFQASDAVIEVNPRHVRFYERRFGFRQIGKLRLCPRVNAPAVLLHQTLDRLTLPGPEQDGLPGIAEELGGNRARELAEAC